MDEYLLVTMDYRVNRMNVDIVGGIVLKCGNGQLQWTKSVGTVLYLTEKLIMKEQQKGIATQQEAVVLVLHFK